MPEPSSVLPPLLASPFSVSLRPLLGVAAVLCGVVTGAVYGAPALNVTRASSFHLLFVWTFPYVWCRLVQPLFPRRRRRHAMQEPELLRCRSRSSMATSTSSCAACAPRPAFSAPRSSLPS